ncbi:MAG: ATP-binding protein [Janthinobacterium lividum]
MKHLLLLLTLLAAYPPCLAYTPGSAALRIDRLPPSGLLLQKGWRYHAGDDPAWARPDFDDRRWDTINPARPRRELPPTLGNGISWLRLRLHLGDSLRLQTLVLQAWELGACELYLNGRLLLRQGTLAANPAQVRPRGVNMPPGEVSAGGPAEQVLAVRYAPWQPRLLFGLGNRAQLKIRLFTPKQYWQFVASGRASVDVFLVAVGIFGLLTLLHWAFFHYNPTQQANRYFARFALALTLAFLSGYGSQVLAYPTQAPHLVVAMLNNGLGPIGSIWAVRALYALFKVQPGRLYTGLWVSCGVMLLLLLLGPYHQAHVIAQTLLTLLAAAEQLRLTVGALRRGHHGAWIIAGGFAGGLSASLVILLLLRLAVTLQLEATTVTLLIELLALLMYLLPALSISLFLAREFALDAELLQVKLGEVERLSAQTLAQEQEKQSLLARQNETLETQVAQRTSQLQRSLTDLRATQNQLIQAEKMASLGELTAGIAHEIQNPLNFVNNFSEVSAELVGELETEQQRPARDATLETELLQDLKQNLVKISEHGRRASGIVRGMLEHSRQRNGVRQSTDINALADEYLRLAYHGLRAKDKTFNATLQTDLTPALPPIEAVGGDLGRVLLNLFTNAFYAVHQRQQAGEAGYEPTVGVATRRVGSTLEVRVHDNGMGMSAAVQAKIFQPFFTTKPTGEGTGLGLSLSYDIVTKGHGGTLTVVSQVDQGTEFTIVLPA